MALRGSYVHKIWQSNPHLDAAARYRKACAYDAFIPDPLSSLELAIPGDLSAQLSEAETAIAGLNSHPRTYLAALARLLLRTESIASSKVEGLQIDARSLARAEAKLEAGRSIGQDALEILASVDAMELAVERAATSDEIGVDDVRDIHAALLSRAAPKIAGRVRTAQNWIGGNDYNPCGADYVPPPPEHVGALLGDLAEFCNDDRLAPLVSAAIAHAQFETIHPFEDGNGRTGRALVQVILRRRELAPAYVPPISVMLAKHKSTYIAGLTSFREGEMSRWLGVFADATAAAARLAQRYVQLVADLQQQWRVQLREVNPRSDAAAWSVIDVLPAHPVITVSIGVAATRRTKPAVSNALQQLEAAGVLTPLSESSRNRSWEAIGLLDLIAGLEAGE